MCSAVIILKYVFKKRDYLIYVAQDKSLWRIVVNTVV